MSIRDRLLGFAFASSDLLLELNDAGKIVFALGSGPSGCRSADSFCGMPLTDGLVPTSRSPLKTLLTNLEVGSRSAPIPLTFEAGDGRVRRAVARFFRLPDLAPNTSCSVTWEGPTEQSAPGLPALSPDAFLSRARDVLATPPAPSDVAVTFIDVEGLAGALATGEAGARLHARVEAALQSLSIDGACLGQLGPERFAMLRENSAETDIATEVECLALGRAEGVELTVRATEAPIEPGAQPLNVLRALRFAVEACLNGDAGQPDLTFKDSLAKTLDDARGFTAVVKDRRFDLHYQPVVNLKTGAVVHFEALSRFKGGGSPAPTIRMAEELGLIDAFDVAVAEMALARLRRPGAGLLKFAVNVSGASLADDGYVQALLRMTAARPDERRRLIVEVTESAALTDPTAANRRLSALREAGFRICIDDFGAGSASYQYLRDLSVDTVKIDGKFMENLDTDPRAQTLVRHLVELCQSMKIDTIAEMIETQAVADVLRDLGVDQGQGWLFGKAEAEPRTVLTSPTVARRVGAVVGWG